MPTVLIVDDDEQARIALEMAVAPVFGSRIRIATDGVEALAIFLTREARIDAIVTDLALPRMDGYQLTARIREDPEFKRIPIVVVTADASPEVSRRLTSMGVDAVFRKPFSNSELRLKLEALLNAQ
jgi:CheY-like chemotaxis protein